MKFSVKLIAAVLCAAMLCVPTLAAGSSDAPGAGTYVPDPQYTMAWGTATWQDNGSLLVRKSGENKPTDGMALWTKNAIVLDAISGEPVDAKSIKDGSTVYAWLGAQTAMTMSLPPQVTPELLLVNIPADFKVPQYDVIVRANYIMKGIPGYSGMAITLSDGTACQVWQDAAVTPYLTRNRVTYQDLLPGTRVLVWADDEGQASRVIVFPYEYKGGLSLNGNGFLCVNGYLTVYPPALRRPYNDERLYAPIRAVAEAAGYSVSWDNEFGVTVKDGSDILFQICPDTKLAHGPAAADRHSLAGPCLIADGVTYLEAGDLAHLLGMFYGG
ncbi:stalk domain-containing protein [Dysosmobacter sp.]|uniref:stalk domain-containing protein n=1 Tax=Dysosmobacter sp. TaxID=2591382 RepID=UPI00307C362E